MDISSLALKKDTFHLHLRHPASDELLYDGEMKDENAVTISLYGTASKEYRDAVKKMQNRALKRGKKQATAEQIQEEGVELLVAISDGSRNLTHKGSPVSGAEAFRSLYADAQYSWLREQVDAAVGDVTNFLEQ